MSRIEESVDLEPSICIRGLNHYFGQGEGRKQVLFNNSLDLYPGEIVIMTGPSGSGKTTLLTLIGTLRSVQEGSLRVQSRELKGLSASRLVQVRRSLGFIFQAHNLFFSLTAMQNVRMAMELQNYSQKEMYDRASTMLDRLGLGHRLNYKPQALSGGQRQRVAIARALVNRPKVILADEPTAALDKDSGREVVTMLQEFAKEEGSTILLVTHDNRILDVADRIVNMVDGSIISDVMVAEAQLRAEFLRRCELFEKLTAQTIADVADKIGKSKYPPKADIVRQGEEGDRFYIIRRGRVEVLVDSGDGNPKQVATMGEGDFFGETALIKEQPRNATVRALEPVEVYFLNKDDFRATLESSSTFAQQIRQALFQRQ